MRKLFLLISLGCALGCGGGGETTANPAAQNNNVVSTPTPTATPSDMPTPTPSPTPSPTVTANSDESSGETSNGESDADTQASLSEQVEATSTDVTPDADPATAQQNLSAAPIPQLPLQAPAPACTSWSTYPTGYEGVYSLYKNECFNLVPYYITTQTYICDQNFNIFISGFVSADSSVQWGPLYGQLNQYGYTFDATLPNSPLILSCLFGFNTTSLGTDVFTMACSIKGSLSWPCSVQYIR